MENRITTGTFVAFACSAMLAYAAPQNRPQPGAPTSATGSGRDQQTTTITGCLQQGSSSRRFVLVQTSGGREPQVVRYELVADTRIDLSTMAGYQVEATGSETLRVVNAQRSSDRARGSAETELTRFIARSIKPTGYFC